jgi:hypothetical protein
MVPRNRLVALLAIVFAWVALHAPAHSQTSPPLKIVVPLAAGGGADILARILAEEIGRAQHSSVVVENRPGAGTVIGTEAVARAAPDGETVLLNNPAFLINPHIKKVTYDPLIHFDPVCNMVNFPLVFVVPKDSPLKSMADMIAMVKERATILERWGYARHLGLSLEREEAETVAAEYSLDANRARARAIAVGTGQGVFRTLDSDNKNEAASWHKFGAGLPNVAVTDLHFDPTDKKLIIATFGRIWRASR